MSVREEDRNKNCPSRGLGIAAAAIGVGVGAALYYIFSKRPEDPSDEGATTSGWTREQPCHLTSDGSYTTISEHSTSDTSIESDSEHSAVESVHDNEVVSNPNWSEDSYQSDNNSSSIESSESDHDSDSLVTRVRAISKPLQEMSSESDDEVQEYFSTPSGGSRSVEWSPISSYSNSGMEWSMGSSPHSMTDRDIDSDTNREWDVTTSSLDVPIVEVRSRSPINVFSNITNRLLTPEMSRVLASEQSSTIEDRAFRERSWSLEECSICFDVMLRDQEVMALGCTHRFHQACILPWLQEKQTCPNCRMTN